MKQCRLDYNSVNSEAKRSTLVGEPSETEKRTLDKEIKKEDPQSLRSSRRPSRGQQHEDDKNDEDGKDSERNEGINDSSYFFT